MVTQDIRINRSIFVIDASCPPQDEASSVPSSSTGVMTIEQSSSTSHNQEQTELAQTQSINRRTSHVTHSREGVLTQLKEITGVEDAEILKQALEASRNESGTYDLSQAVNILVDENAVRYNQTRQVVPKSVAGSTPSTNQTQKPEEDVKVIDLTFDNSEKDELQKAIALSLQEQQHGMLGGQVSAEEQDISLVLEQSLAESKVGTKRKRGEVWQDPLNPHERKRTDCCPVGLKNVGNTCWFSAVIQSLFHLPVFRHLVLNFVPRLQWNLRSLAANSPAKRNLLFMQELRSLFALMVGTRRKYVDPSKAVDILKEAFQSGSTDSQQDVSEFTHKLLEWLEDAFKCDTSSRSPSPLSALAIAEECLPESAGVQTSISDVTTDVDADHRQRNPMVDLFYGQFRSEGLNNGHVFCNVETFGQYPLQVNGFGNIHESLEAATAQEIETNNTEAMTKSGQEHWFTQLPPVLLFELSRFQFNQHFGRPEKIHNKFDFPEVVYMDRYMEVNKDITRSKRVDISKLKEQRDELQSRLEKFLNFGSGCKRFPLQEVLQYTLEFVENKRESTSPLPTDVEMSSPISNSYDSPNTTPVKLRPSNQLSSSMTPRHPPRKTTPSPKNVSETELRTLQNCLRRWRTEVENDVKELQDLISNINCKIGTMYNEPLLHKVPYRLHAVLVHEGQAASGHYWAYVYDHVAAIWLKFNDITVTEATWDELQKESAGGHHNASAYCLMYIDSTRKELIENSFDEETGQQMNNVDSLLPELRNLVFEDNVRFQKEIEAWDMLDQVPSDKENEQPTLERKTHVEESSGAIVHAPVVIPKPVNLARFALTTSTPRTVTALSQWFERMEDIIRKEGPPAANKVVQLTMEHFKQLANIRDPVRDARLQHVAVYAIANGIDDDIVLWLILEMLAFQKSDLPSMGSHHDLSTVFLEKMNQFVSQRILPHHREVCSRLKNDFQSFRRMTGLFAKGMECYHDERYAEALPCLVNACSLNETLMHSEKKETFGCQSRGLDSQLLASLRCQCLLKLNEQASDKFESEDADEAKEAVELMNDFVVPCMNVLTSSDASSNEDNMAAERIRGTWCSKLGGDENNAKSGLLQEFLVKLLDPSTDVKLREHVSLLRDAHQLSREKFQMAMELAMNSRDTSKATR